MFDSHHQSGGALLSKSTNKPNTIVFFTDQQRWDTLGAYGNPLNLTPNADSIAQRGTLFQHAFTPQPLCGPARSIMQTGLYPTVTGCYRNGRALPLNGPTLARSFAESGYDTAYIGKWHLASTDPVPLEERAGYRYWLAANALEWSSRPYDTVVYDGDNQSVRLPGYRTDALIDASIRYIDTATRNEQPFFLYLSLLEPHHQNDEDRYVCPDGYERYGSNWCPEDLAALVGSAPLHLAGYLGMVKRIDEGLGRVLDALKSLDIVDNTNILFTTDHGCHFRTRNAEYKRSCHEASIRIPMVAQGPYFDGRGVVNSMVSLLDVPSMLADASGLKPLNPAGAKLGSRTGQNSQNNLLRASNPDSTGKEQLLIQLSEAQIGRALRTRQWKYSVAAVGTDGVDTGSASEYWESHLYNLERDPHELTNLITDEAYSEVRDRLRADLVEEMHRIGETGFVIHSGSSPNHG